MTPQRFLNIQAAVYNTFYLQRHLCNRLTFKRFRKDAFNVWESASAAALKGNPCGPLRPNPFNVTMLSGKMKVEKKPSGSENVQKRGKGETRRRSHKGGCTRPPSRRRIYLVEAR